MFFSFTFILRLSFHVISNVVPVGEACRMSLWGHADLVYEQSLEVGPRLILRERISAEHISCWVRATAKGQDITIYYIYTYYIHICTFVYIYIYTNVTLCDHVCTLFAQQPASTCNPRMTSSPSSKGWCPQLVPQGYTCELRVPFW